jgi:hypothetical protein
MRIKYFLLICFVFEVCAGRAIASERVVPSEEEPKSPTSLENRDHSNFTIVGSYGLYSFMVGGKKGVQLAYIPNKKWTLQLDYFSGDFGLKKFNMNLFSVKERTILMQARRYFGGTFNVVFGVGEREYTVELGDRIMRYVPAESRYDGNLLSVKNYVVDFGVGNRWQWKNGITVGADWIAIEYPISQSRIHSGPLERIEHDKTRRDVKRAIGYMQYMPTVTVAKLNFGYTF